MCRALAGRIGVHVTYVDPGFGDLGHAGLARYCIGEVKEGMGAGGAMYLANLMGHSPDTIREGDPRHRQPRTVEQSYRIAAQI